MEFKKLLKYKVMVQLKPQRRNIAPSGCILIKKSLYEKFIEFGVTGRYTYNEEAMEFLDLEERRYIETNHFTYLRRETFQIRVSKEKTVNYLDHNLIERKARSGYFVFWYRFIRYHN
jgi:hypothetical protein